MPPLGWLGDIIIVLFFVLRATPWLVRGYYYRFVMITECVSLFFGVCVCLMFCEVGFDSPTKLVSCDPLVYW